MPGAGPYAIGPRADPAPTDDPLYRWAAGQPGGAARVFASGEAAAVAAPALSMRDRLVVTGPADDAIPLVREVLREVGPSYRPLGGRELIDAVVAAVPGLRATAGFGWMDRTGPDRRGPERMGPASPVPGEAVPGAADLSGACVVAQWLPSSDGAAVTELLDEAFPDSYAYPGRPGAADRWAGLRADGRPVAVAALAWCAPTVGLMAGVATAPAARGRGLGRAVCAFVVQEALAAYGTVALMVDDWNGAALRLYRGLGLAYRPLRAAALD
jgi:GNAT superfamily N-acetyltransferase